MIGSYSKLVALIGFSLSASAQAAEIRDVRPTMVSRGDKMVIEAEPDHPFTVGAPTVVSFDTVQTRSGAIVLPARAVGPTRVVLDVDEAFELQLGHQHYRTLSNVSVTQTVGAQTVVYKNDPRDQYDLDLFPYNLQRVANGGGGHAIKRLLTFLHLAPQSLTSWLGLTVEPVVGGLKVADLQVRFDKNDLLARFDQPPLDGKITKEEAKVGQPDGLSTAEFNKLDANHDGVITLLELEDQEGEAGLAANAGIKLGDTILTADAKPVGTEENLEDAWKAGSDRVHMTIKRLDGREVTFDLPRAGAPSPLPSWIVWAIVLMLVATVVALPVPIIAGLVVVWERKISAYMQSRIGPNRVGPNGWLQWLADGLKLIMKEDIIPTEADPILFKMSPYLAFIGVFLTFIIIPFSHYMIVSDLNIGLLFLLSVTSLVVVSIIMGGWSSNSKWALLGGMRSAAQIISYELPASVALLSIVTITGSLSTQRIVDAQGGMPYNWFVFRNPFTFVAFFIWFISALAEGNRTPFDLPEAESELVSGYNTEYSGFRFSLYPMVEWVNLFIIGAVGSTLFLGGARLPMVWLARQEHHLIFDLLGAVVFLAKDIFFIFVIIWIRWTLPRFRVDQMMNLCWKYFIPASFVCLVGTIAYTWLVPEIIQSVVKVAMFAVFGLGLGAWFMSRVWYNKKRYSDLVLNQALGKSNL